MADPRPRRAFPCLLLLLSLALAACVRPQLAPSPFEQHFSQASTAAAALPVGPQPGPAFLILPDSELVYGPSLAAFSLPGFVNAHLPELAAYTEEVAGQTLTGLAILAQISRDYSVSPRLLLALLRERSAARLELQRPFLDGEDLRGLFRQLSWAANQLNRGYYTHRVAALTSLTLPDGVMVTLDPTLNSATAALQRFYALLLPWPEWQLAVGPLGLNARYVAMFGDPQSLALDPLLPPGLAQPELGLPFAQEEGWYFTSGPHAAWGSGAAWAALDFAPPKPDQDAWGCYQSDAWVRAVADGQVVRVADGLVVQDLDGDGFEGTGWSILYMHIAARERVQPGAWLSAGDPLGHPSCEGGPSNGAHLHLARRYNGEWIPADQELPFSLSGWVSSGFGVEYDGALTRSNGTQIQPSGFPTDENRLFP